MELTRGERQLVLPEYRLSLPGAHHADIGRDCLNVGARFDLLQALFGWA